ncbi:uncharacterized protein ACIBXB_009154 [Morphnus guianensis]
MIICVIHASRLNMEEKLKMLKLLPMQRPVILKKEETISLTMSSSQHGFLKNKSPPCCQLIFVKTAGTVHLFYRISVLFSQSESNSFLCLPPSVPAIQILT